MCIAAILMMNSFFSHYETMMEYCEHVTAAFVLLITVAMVFIPAGFLLFPSLHSEMEAGEVEDEKAYLAIVVLVGGVAGGLITVIAFIFLCKYCNKPQNPLTTTTDAVAKKHGDRERKGYHLLDSQLILSPDKVPATAHTFRPQDNNNSSAAVNLATAAGAGKRRRSSQAPLLRKSPQSSPEDRSLSSVDEKPISVPPSRQRLAAKTSLPPIPSSRRESLEESPRSRVKSSSFAAPEEGSALCPPSPVWRGRYALPRTPPTVPLLQRRQYPVEALESGYFYGTFEDRRFPPHLPDLTLTPPIAMSEEAGRLSRLPRSHQLVVDKTSPPPVSPFHDPHQPAIHFSGYNVSPSRQTHHQEMHQMYPYGHRNAISQAEERRMYTRSDPRSYSHGQAGEAASFFHPFYQFRERFRQNADVERGCPEQPSEWPGWSKVYRQIQTVFGSGSSSSGGGPNFWAPQGPPPQHYAPHAPPHGEHCAPGAACRDCQSDLQRRSHGPDARRLRRQRAEEPQPPVMSDDVVQHQQIMAECKELWSLRESLEASSTEPSLSFPGRINVGYEVEEGLVDSVATSFESNTEPLPFDDHPPNPSPRKSNYLEPPMKLSLEAKRLKYKKLLEKRQLEGASWSESVDTGASTDSAPFLLRQPPSPASIPDNSFDSNGPPQRANDSPVSESSDSASRRSKLLLNKDSGYRSQSIETPGAPPPSLRLPSPPPHTPHDRRNPFDRTPPSPSASSSIDDEVRAAFDAPPTPNAWYRQRTPQRDLSIDSRTDALFKEFTRFDPRLERRFGSRFSQASLVQEQRRQSTRSKRHFPRPPPLRALGSKSCGQSSEDSLDGPLPSPRRGIS